MDAKAFKTLEFDRVLAQAALLADSERARKLILETVPAENLENAQTLQTQTAQADKVMYEYSLGVNFAVDDVEASVLRAKKFSTLTMAELLKISRVLKVARILRQNFAKFPDIDTLRAYSDRIFVNQPLEEKIDKSILSETEVSDDASLELKSIRNKMRRCNENVKSKLNSYITSSTYQKYLQDNLITVREDRYVIPLKSEYKGMIAGLIHDQSASGQTLYVEPLPIVELNNELKTLIIEEQREIERILSLFTAQVAADATELLQNFELVLQLDVIFARAKFARKIKAVRPLLNETGYINIIKGRHPLINAEKVVPVSVYLGKTFDILLITGPNAGGKTVTLKLIGLFTLMAMSGLFIPAADGSELSLFDSVFCDIGDEQSIEQSLSTFSGHMTNIVSFIDRITQRTLLLLDELGSGTDPSEGAALAVAITKYIKKSGAKAVITSHFNDLKEFALTVDKVETASMDFNADTYEPTYRLIVGATGASNALHIVRRLGLKERIIKEAEGLLSEESKNFERILYSAEQARKRAEDLTEQARQKKAEAEKDLSAIQAELARLRENNEKLNEQIRKETKKLIEASIDEADEILDEMKEQAKIGDDRALFEARRLKKKLESISAKYDDSDLYSGMDETLNVVGGKVLAGDWVYIENLDKTAKVLDLTKRGDYEVLLGSVKTIVKAKDCKKVRFKERKPAVTIAKPFSSESVPTEINVIGQTVDEAVITLDSYLNRAQAAHVPEVRIIHGKGSGALRKGVQKYLASHPSVAEYRDGLYGEGERGVTFAKLK